MKVCTRSLIVALILLCAGCASAQERGNPDPFENFNRGLFFFNDGLDRNIVAPLSRGYRAITPTFIERGVRNFFANLYDFNGAINAVLQGRFREAAQNGGRFVVNSTVGMLGTLDIASEMGVAPYRTDFGHTLALWGFDSGPYLMVPFFGPRTVRSGTGFVFDTVASVQWGIDSTSLRLSLFALEVIDTRAALTEAEELITGDRYIFIRDIYLQQREAFVNDGVIQDSFLESEEEFDWEE
ncbi:MAG: VacJ family lipoprotein [Gammaproteobacteria bacterium]|nr:VacJ family lipoprotein [Gammaproteobacteria bacterium]